MLGRLVARAATLVTHSEPPRLFTELGRHPRLFRAWLPFGGVLLFRSELPRIDAELVVLRTAYNSASRYEWVHHVAFAARAGLSPDAIAAVPDGESAAVWTWRQQLLLRATDELHTDRRIRPATTELLEHMLADRQLIELCVLVGHYEMLAMLLNSRGVAPEPSAVRRLPARFAAVGEIPVASSPSS